MKKNYSLKKTVFIDVWNLKAIMLFLVFWFSVSSSAQCTIAINGLYPAETFTPTCTGSNQTIVVDAYASEYSNVTIQANKNYTFTSSVATDFVTITNAAGTVVYASGTSPLVWSSGTNTGIIRYFLHLNSSCSQQDTNRIKYISCQETVCTTAEFGLYPNETFTPTCTGTAEVIANDSYASEYSNVNVLSGSDYSFSSSVTTDFITITNATATTVLASGTTPLVWNSSSYSGVIRYFLHTNVNCGAEEIFRSKRITCQPITNCNAPSNVFISNVFSTNAQLNWNAASPGPSVGYDVYYSTTNSISAATTPTSTATGTTTYLSNLSPSTTYYTWIRSNCGNSLVSSWVSVPSFTTPASTLTGCTTALYGLYPGLPFTPACTGNVEEITTLAYASEYSNINIISNKQYIFSSSVTTDFVTITNSNATVVLASGPSPLVWNSAGNTGAIRYFLHTNSSCGTQNVDRTKNILCQDAPPQSCTPPSNLTASNITTSSAQLNWNAAIPAPSGGYDIYYSTTNSIAPTTIPIATVSSGLVSSIGSLTPETTYYYWVRSNCQNSTVSSWVSGGSFTTVAVVGTGCVSAPYGLYPDTPMVPNCTTSAEATVLDAYAGEYSNVTILANRQYTFESAITSDFITISNANATVIYASGTTPLVWNSGAISGTVRYYIHTDASCTAQEIWRIKTVSCTGEVPQTCNVPTNLTVSNLFTTDAQLNWNAPSPVPNTGYDIYLSVTNSITAATVPIGTVAGLIGNLGGLSPGTTYYFWVRSNCGTSGVSSWVAGPSFTTAVPTGTGCVTGSHGLYPETAFTPACSGVSETIVTDAYAGEYSNVNIVANKQYTFTSSVATDYITISNENATVIYASGVSPLVWNSAANTGVIRYYFHTNSACGEAATDRTRAISCQDAAPTCPAPSNLTVSNVYPTNAQLDWNAASPAPANGYDVYFSTTNSITGSTIPLGTINAQTAFLNNLIPGTTYYAWIRSNCSSSSVSSWVASGSFTTTIPTGTGCVTSEFGRYPDTTFTPTCTGTNQTIVTDAYAGEFCNVAIVPNTQYTFSSSVATDFITISNNNATIIYASGITPLVWNSGTNSGVIRYYFHTNSSCASQNIDRTKLIRCQASTTTCAVPSNLTVSNLFTTSAQLNWNAASPAPSGGYDVYFSTTNSITAATTPIGTVAGLNGLIAGLAPGTTYYFWIRSNCGTSNVSSWVAGPSFTTSTPTGTGCITATYGLYPTTTFTPACSGVSETIVTDAYAGEYSNVNIVANKQYTFTSSVATDYITISNANATVIYASGVSPLIWNSAANTGVIRYYFHTNSACGEAATNRTRAISCQDAAPTCAAPSNLTVSNVLTTNAQLNWNAASPAPADGYDVYFSTTNSVNSTTVPSATVTGLSNVLNNLTPGTTYYFWVRSYCSVTNLSNWIAGPSFTTLIPTGTGCINASWGQYPAAVFTPNCTGTSEEITFAAYAGEYSNVNIIENKEYTFTSSVATDFITISNENATVIYTSGVTPLVWNSGANTGVIRYYFHTNAGCGEDNTNRSRAISCQDATIVCNPPTNVTYSNITDVSAQATWNAAVPTPLSYSVYFSTSNTFPVGVTPNGIVSGNTANLNGLTPSTLYNVWVRSNCTSIGDWYSAGNFTTLPAASAGCTNATYGLYPTTTFTPNCTSTAQQIVNNAYAGEYTNVAVLDNTTYTFSSSVATDYITITNQDAGVIYASGVTPLVWNSGTTSGVIRYYFHTNSACGELDTNRIKYISCPGSVQPCNEPSNLTVSNVLTTNAQLNWNAASPVPANGYDVYFSTTNSVNSTTVPSATVTSLSSVLNNLTPGTTYYVWVRSNCGGSNVSSWVSSSSFTTATPTGTGCITATYGLYPTATFTPNCTGTAETIITNAYAGEYSKVNVIANKEYTFTSSVATDFITISNENATVIYASGATPLVWNSEANTGVIRYYFHTNSTCGESNTNRTRAISCQDAAPTCAAPSNLTVTNVLTTAAQLNWNAAVPAPAFGYDVYYGTTDLFSEATYVGIITGLTRQLDNLAPSTTYYFWVNSNCGGFQTSEVVAGPSFTTATPTGTGCIISPYGLYPTATFTPACSGVNETISISAFTGEYSNVNIVANKQYTFTSSVATDYITITNDNATVIYASGTSPLVWNSTTNTGSIRYYMHLNSSCESSNDVRSKLISCQDETGVTCSEPSNFTFSNITPIMAQVNWSAATPEPTGYNVYYSTINSITPETVPTINADGTQGNMIDLVPSTTYYVWVRSYCSDNDTSNWVSAGSFTTLPYTGVGCISSSYGLYPNENFIPACSGLQETIVTNAYAGQYSSVAVSQNMQYTFSTSVATDYITITDATATVVYAYGPSPLVWDSNTHQENIRYLIHTNSNCEEEEVNRARYISCTTLLSNPNVEKSFARVYPNPTTAIVNIVGDSNFDTIVILNSLGQVIKELETHSNEIQVDLSNYASGVYFIKVFIADANQTYKLVKE